MKQIFLCAAYCFKVLAVAAQNVDINNTDLKSAFKKIIPEAVVEPANGDPLGMKYNELIPVLVKGMQEPQKIIENQQKKMELQ